MLVSPHCFNPRSVRAGWVLSLCGMLWLGGCRESTAPVTRSPPHKPAAAPAANSPPALTTRETAPEPIPSPETAEPIAPAPVFRPVDQRPQHDDAALTAVGIRRLDSKHLRLYTDIPLEHAAKIPAAVDALVRELSRYFGELPPARDQQPFQMTGYLIRSEALFREARLIPEDLPTFDHGRHRGQEFWLRDQEQADYRRHLVLHEATHCFMTLLPEHQSPVWYLEGMAELFGVHRQQADGSWEFRRMPESPQAYAGFGRITLIQQEIAAGRRKTIVEVAALRPEEYLQREPYAWSWALCYFLDQHPRTSARFRELGQHRSQREFAPTLQRLFGSELARLEAEWRLFVEELAYGFDLPSWALTWGPAAPPITAEPARSTIATDHGWQSSGAQLEAGRKYRVRATGRVIVATTTAPWESEANGLTLRYVRGEPIGRLMGWIPTADAGATTFIPLGPDVTLTAAESGPLLLRVNDHPAELRENRGAYSVEIVLVEE